HPEKHNIRHDQGGRRCQDLAEPQGCRRRSIPATCHQRNHQLINDMNRRAMNKRMNFWMPVLLLLVAASGCEKNGATSYSTDFHPRIFDRTGVFTSPSMIISQGETANFTGLLFSPAAAVDISWKVDGTEVSTDTAFAFTPDGGGEYTITLEVSNGNPPTSRTSSILV